MNRFLTACLTLAAGIAIGWIAVPMIKRAPVISVQEELVQASRVLDPEQQALDVRAAFAKADAAGIKALANYVEDLANRRPDIPLREEFLRRWGEVAPKEAFAYLGPNAKPRDLQAVLTAWGRTDPDGAAESFQPSENDQTESLRANARALLAGLAEADIEKAIRFADRCSLADLDRLEFKYSPFPSSPSFDPSGYYQEAFDAWVQRDPATAFEVIITLRSPKVREQALNELFHTWHYDNPKASQAAADRFWKEALSSNHSGDLPMNPGLMETLANHLGELTGKEAYERAFQITDPDLRRVAIEYALAGWKGWDGENLPAVADFIVNTWRSFHDGTADGKGAITTATEWTARELIRKEDDLGKAVAFLEKLPAGTAREAAVEGILSGWSWSPEKQFMFSAWIDALPPSRHQDIAVAKLISKVPDQSPAKALDMAANIEDSTLRAASLASVGARFIPKHQGGTKAFDLEEWARDYPEIMKELRAAGGNH
jgi:hypothetical protein